MQPTVSIIVPCYNEQATIGSLLGAIHAQTYPREKLEVVVADGHSTDGTRRAISSFKEAHPDLAVHLVDNDKRSIPAGLNRAIAEGRGEIVIRLDAHSMPIPEYVERCVRALEDGKGANVGGVWDIRPGASGWMARGIAAAASHPLGAGDALYRLGGPARAVDTVPFGAFRRELVSAVGGFDETLLTNEDYEFNVRVRQHGGVVWLDPQIRSTYWSRPGINELAQQYWRYGFWKYRMLNRYPASLRWRQVLPPLLVLGMAVGAAVAVFWPAGRVLLAIGAGLYLLTLAGAGVQLAWRSRDALVAVSAPLALVTMHFAWGCGFLASIVAAWLGRHG